MSAVIIKQGLLDTVQDEGRYGFQHIGINPGGVMDKVAATIANMLAGNKATAPVIELHFPASSFIFKKPCLIGIAGGDFGAVINNIPIDSNSSIVLPAEAVLKFTKYARGSRCYLAVSGGWIADRWLNSFSTNLKASAGGFKGRPLKKDDEILFGEQPVNFNSSNNIPVIYPYKGLLGMSNNPGNIIRCVTGAEYNLLDEKDKDEFTTSEFQINIQSDRMGYRLNGNVLQGLKHTQLSSSAVTRGTIQLLPSGQMIILMADHQTTGGYPKIAHVISADFSKLAQMRPNDFLQFQLVTLKQAEEAFIKQQEYLKHVEDEVNLHLKQFMK